MIVISADRLTKTVSSGDGSLTIVDNVSLAVNAGERVAVVGVSGSGKSSLLGLLAGLDAPTAGSVTLDGKSLDNLNEDQLAQVRAGRVGFVFQNFQLLSGLTALENVLLPLELNPDNSAPGNADSVARQALASVGLADRATHYPAQLSGGEQQRVALARAFAPSPRILFADEPTGNLDRATGERVADLLMELNASQNTTLFMVTHDNALANRCDRIFRIEAGRLEEVDRA